MSALLSFGSNLGNRLENLESAAAAVERCGLRLLQASPVVESPALLPPDAPAEWNRPYLNAVAEVDCPLSPHELLALAKRIEGELGRTSGPRWSPRVIDIDIVLFDDLQLDDPDLTIPHAGLESRAFVLAPLTAIAPQRPIPGGGSVLATYRQLTTKIPLWMGIVNVTPDSFSDGGRHLDMPSIDTAIGEMLAAGVAIVDLGAESTRPGATPLRADAEWERLAPPLERVADRFRGRRFRPAISVDTYHPEVARRAIAAGADIINDVGGLLDPSMVALAAERSADWVAMHQLSLPADPTRTLATDRSPTDQVLEWLDRQLGHWTAAGVDCSRLLFDPGIGFGKTPLQSLTLIRDIERFLRTDLRVLVGHSRKSFLQSLGGETAIERDPLTIGASLSLARRGADVLRVHNVVDHAATWRGFVHAESV